jgi:hypothetical protein
MDLYARSRSSQAHPCLLMRPIVHPRLRTTFSFLLSGNERSQLFWKLTSSFPITCLEADWQNSIDCRLDM